MRQRKVIVFVLLTMLAVALAALAVVGAPSYFYYRASDSCRVLEAISKNKALSASLSDSLTSFINDPAVKNDPHVTTSIETGWPILVFELWEFDRSLPVDWDELGVPQEHAQFKLRTNSRFDQPYEIQEVGIGYSRAYLMFSRQNLNGGDGGRIWLNPNSYVECNVYSNPE